MDRFEFLKLFHALSPEIQAWIDTTLTAFDDKALPVSAFNYRRLPDVFPKELLAMARVVVVQEKVPIPPLDRLGLNVPDLIEHEAIAGITYKNTFFVHRPHLSESLFFHELVHVVQWERLGVDKFLFAYGAGLLQYGYQNSPLEKMAYIMQTGFENNASPENLGPLNLIKEIEQQTDAIWEEVSHFIPVC